MPRAASEKIKQFTKPIMLVTHNHALGRLMSGLISAFDKNTEVT